MRSTKKTTGANDTERPPKWMLEELKADPDLLRVVTEVVRAFRRRSPRGTNPQR